MKHFLISGKGFRKGLFKRACMKGIWTIGERNKLQGTFKRKEVNCKNCKKTKMFKSGKRNHI